jgi:hypothetical protein
LLDPDNFGFTNPTVLSAETHNPEIANPAIANPSHRKLRQSPTGCSQSRDREPKVTPIRHIANPAIVVVLNPASPIRPSRIRRLAIRLRQSAITNQSVTDATYPVTNAGRHTSTSYAVKLFQKSPLPQESLQLIPPHL